MWTKEEVKREADNMANGAIAYLKCFPCSLCVAEHNNKCLAGYKYRGCCPVNKKISEKLNVL